MSKMNGRRGVVVLQMWFLFYLILAAAVIIFFFNRADSEIKGDAFLQRVDLTNLKFILGLIPASGEVKISYNAEKFRYWIEDEQAFVQGESKVSSYYSKDEKASITFDRDGDKLIVEGRNG